MPLDRAHVTAASRTMLPTYPLFAGGIGLNFVIRGNDLIQAGVFYEVASRIVPLRVWGILFLATALVMVLALARRHRLLYQLGLALLVGVLLVWSAVGLMAAIMEVGSYSAILWPGFVITACVASFRSLNVGER